VAGITGGDGCRGGPAQWTCGTAAGRKLIPVGPPFETIEQARKSLETATQTTANGPAGVPNWITVVHGTSEGVRHPAILRTYKYKPKTTGGRESPVPMGARAARLAELLGDLDSPATRGLAERLVHEPRGAGGVLSTVYSTT